MTLSRSHVTITEVFPLLLLIFFACACQVNIPPTPTATTVLPTTTSNLPATPTFAITSPSVLSPSGTPKPSTTTSLKLTATMSPVPLTAGGDWLLYQRILLYPEGGFSEVLFVSNQDGSDIRMMSGPDCEISAPISIVEDSANRLMMLDGKFVLINLGSAVAQSISPDCRTKYNGSAAGGLLATINREMAAAELRVFELPEGKLRSAFPIPPCSGSGQVCSFDTGSGEWVAQWDSSGRYLIFPVILDGARSDLYLYDAHNGATRQLASVQGRVSRIWWSPGATNILLGVSPGGDFFLESFWAVPIANGNTRRLSTTEDYLAEVDLLDWLDENRFLFYSGSLQNVVTAGAYNLRMLDILSNKETTVFGDGFLWAGLDRQAGIVGMIAAVYNSQYKDGTYLVSAAEPTPQKIAPLETAYNTHWDEGLRLFVTSDPCQNGQQGFLAFDSKGRWHCAPAFLSTETSPVLDYPSPDGQWRAVTIEGLWVESTGKPAVKVFNMTPTQVIWRPDSGGFFFIASQSLYYVSLHDLAVQALDHPDQPRNGRWGSDQIDYQWIGISDGR